MEITTKYDIGDKVWSVEYNKGDGYWHVIDRTITYIKYDSNKVIYGFSSNENSETNCLLDDGSYDNETEAVQYCELLNDTHKIMEIAYEYNSK